MRKTINLLFIISILLLTMIPVVFMNLKPDQISQTENRALAEMPVLDRGCTTFMKDITSYVNDRIGLRENMMRFYNDLQYGAMKTMHKQVIFGKENWLFYRDDLADYTGSNIDPVKTEHQVKVITALDAWCKERNIQFILAIGPNKSTIYDNYMPNSIYHCPKSSVDYTVEQLKYKGVAVTYPKDSLIAHRMDHELYYPLDTHWNIYGAQYMFGEIAEILSLPYRKFDYAESETMSGDMQNMIGLQYTGEPCLEISSPLNPNASIETVEGTLNLILHSDGQLKFMCYRDSFTTAMLPFYSYYFDGTVDWTYQLDFDLIEKNRPDVVILSCVERYFDAAIESNSRILDIQSNILP